MVSSFPSLRDTLVHVLDADTLWVARLHGDRRPLAHLVQHLVNHQTYHFGQVTTLVRQLGGQPASLDMVTFDRQRGQ